MKQLTYLLVDLGAALVPFIFSFHPRLKFNRSFLPFFKANLVVTSVYLLWDMVFTNMGIWGFNPAYLTGIYLVNLPLEEVLFFICIPFACVFTYHCLTILFPFERLQKFQNGITVFLLVFLLIVGGVNWNKWYTASAFLGTALLLVYLRFVVKSTWLYRFYPIYLILLIPFFVVNGILTGTGLSEPVVWYNNQENLGIRLLSIPVEDVFYGLGLVLFNIALFLHFSRSKSPGTSVVPKS